MIFESVQLTYFILRFRSVSVPRLIQIVLFHFGCPRNRLVLKRKWSLFIIFLSLFPCPSLIAWNSSFFFYTNEKSIVLSLDKRIRRFNSMYRYYREYRYTNDKPVKRLWLLWMAESRIKVDKHLSLRTIFFFFFFSFLHDLTNRALFYF